MYVNSSLTAQRIKICTGLRFFWIRDSTHHNPWLREKFSLGIFVQLEVFRWGSWNSIRVTAPSVVNSIRGTAPSVVNFFFVEAETRRRWDIFQAEVPLYWELAVRRCSHPSLTIKWLYKVIYRHFWRRDSWRWRQFSNKTSQHNQMHRN